PVDKLTPQDFADMLRPIWLDKPETARRVRQRCHNIMAACWAKGLIQGNPLDVVKLLLPEQKGRTTHQPAMPWQDVQTYVSEQLSHNPRHGSRAALLFLILTAGRSGEIRGATWKEIDLESRLWVIPEERMKAGREHRVPLSDAAIELLCDQLHGDEPRPDA